ARIGTRQDPAEGADAPDALERAPDLGLEDDDEREQPDDGAALEAPPQQLEAEGDCQHVHDDQDADTDHETYGTGPADQAEQPIDQEGRDPDIDDGREANLLKDRSEEIRHRPTSVASRPLRTARSSASVRRRWPRDAGRPAPAPRPRRAGRACHRPSPGR